MSFHRRRYACDDETLTACDCPLDCGAAAALSADVVTRPVAYEHGGVKLDGYLAYDEAVASKKQKAPGVLVIPECWGVTE